jgi:fumarylpyruvate hydrolase
MSDPVVPAPTIPAVPTSDGRSFPVRRVWCVGRNFADHAREMGHDPDREPPFFFAKPADAVVVDGADVPYPPLTHQLEHEVEPVIAIGVGGGDIPVESALEHVWGLGVGIDLTRRDLQAEAKKLGRPWEFGKSFDASAPVSAITPIAEVDPEHGAVVLRVNGEERQRGDLDQLIWSVAEVVAELSRSVRLAPGDLVFAGTPAGVGPVERGDLLEGMLGDVATVRFRVV